MKNKDLIIKIARRLDKFSLDEIIVVAELQEQEVKDILSDLLKTQVIIKNNDTYFFNPKRFPKQIIILRLSLVVLNQSLLRKKMDMKNF